MKYKSIFIIFLILYSFSLLAQTKENGITIGKRLSLKSKVLNEARFYDVYLPASYGTSNKFYYPVIYLIDGDYNFHYVTGLIEQLSSISEKIPEMIVIGIADNGQTNYINNCTPFDKKNNPKGQSEKFLDFITTELQPHINKIYRTAGYNILIGQSLGGLFTINVLLSKPKSFNAYIAISPSLWWDDYKTENKIKPFFAKYDNLNRTLYLSLGNEKGMGVLGFQNQLDINTFADKYYNNKPLGLNYIFKQYPNENHNSVGLITVNDALKFFFKNYDLSDDILDSFRTFKEYEKAVEPFSKMIGKGFRFPNRQFNYIMNSFYNKNIAELKKIEKTIKEKYIASKGDYFNNLGNIYVKKGKIKKGIILLEMNQKSNPNSPEYLTSLANAYFKNKDFNKAKISYKDALDLAKKQHSRQWYINQLKYNALKIK